MKSKQMFPPQLKFVRFNNEDVITTSGTYIPVKFISLSGFGTSPDDVFEIKLGNGDTMNGDEVRSNLSSVDNTWCPAISAYFGINAKDSYDILFNPGNGNITSLYELVYHGDYSRDRNYDSYKVYNTDYKKWSFSDGKYTFTTN